MAARTLPNIGLEGGYTPGEDGWGTGMTANLLTLSVLVQGGVIDKVSATPGSPAAGDVYLMDEAHATEPNTIGVFEGDTGLEAWTFIEPLEGWMVYNQAAGYYEKFSGTEWAELTMGGGGGGGIAEAPVDGTPYARQDAAWVAAPGGGGIADAPSDGTLYGRKDGAWEPAPAPSNAYPVPFGFASSPGVSEVLFITVFAEAVTFPDDFAGAQEYVGVNPTASYTLTVAKNGSTIGTIVIGTGGTVTFATTGAGTESFAIGDVMTVTGAASVDATLANCAFTLLGAR